MDSTIAVAIVGLAGIVASPVLISYLGGRQRRAERAEERAEREIEKALEKAEREAVAAQAAEAARLLQDRQDAVAAQAAEAARLLLASNERVAEQAAAAAAKLDAIKGVADATHLLVNSNLTSALQDELEAHRALHAVMVEVMSLKVAAGLAPDPAAVAAAESTSARIAELEATITDRLRQTKVADSQIAESRH